MKLLFIFLASFFLALSFAKEATSQAPFIERSFPREGETIQPDQVFILLTSGPGDIKELEKHVSFSVSGLAERIESVLVLGPEREEIWKTLSSWNFNLEEMPEKNQVVMIKGKRHFPDSSKVILHWGPLEQDKREQEIAFNVIGPFKVEFTCERERADAPCNPLMPVSLNFSSPVNEKRVSQIKLKQGDGKELPATQISNYGLSFNPPFPQNSFITIELPKKFIDEVGRTASNSLSFPLKVSIGEASPIVKFAAPFGVVETKVEGGALLPVTLRKVETDLEIRKKTIKSKKDIIKWITHVRHRHYSYYSYDGNRPKDLRRVPLLDWKKERSEDTGRLLFKKPHESKEFEVVGIPLKGNGLQVVEIKSPLLGAALLGNKEVMYVAAAGLATNMSVHFKRGEENNLVWVTSLDDAKAVADASVSLTNCQGENLFEGKTNKDGVLLAPKIKDEKNCQDGKEIWVFAEKDDDLSFVSESWDQGIEPWRFQLPFAYESERDNSIAHAVLDRGLYRLGETVKGKIFLREEILKGLGLPDKEMSPNKVKISHLTMNQEYFTPIKWDPLTMSGEFSFKVPRDGYLGSYQLTLINSKFSKECGLFSVEDFKLPLIKGNITSPSDKVVREKKLFVDFQLQFMNGGPASLYQGLLKSYVEGRASTSIPLGFDEYHFDGDKILVGRFSRKDQQEKVWPVNRLKVNFSKEGVARLEIKNLPALPHPYHVSLELDYSDPNGEIQTLSKRFTVHNSSLRVGIKAPYWGKLGENVRIKTAVVDLEGVPQANAPVRLVVFQKKTFSHRKRLVGGFYTYENYDEIKELKEGCKGKSDAQGRFECDFNFKEEGEYLLNIKASDSNQGTSYADSSISIHGQTPYWEGSEDNDRIDLISDKTSYKIGDVAQLEVKMPFQEALALVTVEREGVLSYEVKTIKKEDPFVSIAMRENFSPNIFASVFVVQGRLKAENSNFMIDLSRPSFKIGYKKFIVDRAAHEIKVQLTTDKTRYVTREKVRLKIKATKPQGTWSEQAEVIVVAVDSSLLELRKNESWDLLGAMMRERGISVKTSTLQHQVIGKRHYGLKARPQGGDGGKQGAREFFDTLLLWKAKVPLSTEGEAEVEFPLNDSLTDYTLVAVVHDEAEYFGKGEAHIQTSKELSLYAGVAPQVREGDKLKTEFTLHNTSMRKMEVDLEVKQNDKKTQQILIVGPGEAKIFTVDTIVTQEFKLLVFELAAKEKNGKAQDHLKVSTKVSQSKRVSIQASILAQLDKKSEQTVPLPEGAIEGKGGVRVQASASLIDSLSSVKEFMANYPYNCFEQKFSKLVTAQDRVGYETLMKTLALYQDTQGFLKYFPHSLEIGSVNLTSYFLTLSYEMNWDIPELQRQKMLQGLRLYIEGRLPALVPKDTLTFTLSKVYALDAYSRFEKDRSKDLFEHIHFTPERWTLLAQIQYFGVLQRIDPRGQKNKIEILSELIKARTHESSSLITFSTEKTDRFWDYMSSLDEASLRYADIALSDPDLKNIAEKLVLGAISRQKQGHWDLTTANAWGTVALNKFKGSFEKASVQGESKITIEDESKDVDWSKGKSFSTDLIPWPQNGEVKVKASHNGDGRPWLFIQSLAAIDRPNVQGHGYKITKTMTVVDSLNKTFKRGDLIRVSLSIEAETDMSWVVVEDPLPAGAVVLGTGLGRDSKLAVKGENKQLNEWNAPVFEERSFDFYRAYYDQMKKGKVTIEYTMRLNSSGVLQLPTTRVEAMYAPDIFGELRNENIVVE